MTLVPEKCFKAKSCFDIFWVLPACCCLLIDCIDCIDCVDCIDRVVSIDCIVLYCIVMVLYLFVHV